MSTELFYNSAAQKALTSAHVKSQLGVITAGMTNDGLNAVGLYAVTLSTSTVDTEFYTPVVSYVVDGQIANQIWSGVAKPLADVKTLATARVNAAAAAYISAYQNSNNLNSAILLTIVSQPEVERAATAKAQLDSLTAIANVLQAQITAIDAATTVDQINAVVNPPTSITGALKLTRSGNNLSSGEMPTLTGADKTDLTLVTTNDTIAGVDATVVFPAETGAWTGSPYTWTLKYGIYVLGTGTAGSGKSNHSISWVPPITPLAINS